MISKHKYLTILFFAVTTIGVYAQKDKQKLPLAAKFMKYKLDQVNLSQEQWDTFYALSNELHHDLITLRKNNNISTQLIKKRDSVYGVMMKDPNFKKETYLAEMGKRLQLTQTQMEGFKNTITVKSNFKKEALALLTEEQSIAYSKAKRYKKQTKAKH